MIRILGPGQLAAAPGPTAHESRITDKELCWAHVLNLSPYVFELQDDKQEVRGLVPWFGEAVIPLKVVSEKVVLVVIGTTIAAAPIAATSYAVYIEVTEQQPQQTAKLAAT